MGSPCRWGQGRGEGLKVPWWCKSEKVLSAGPRSASLAELLTSRVSSRTKLRVQRGLCIPQMYLKRGCGARSTPQVGLPSPLRNTVWCTCCARPHAGQDKRPGLQKRRAGAQPLRRSPRTQRPATRTASRLFPLPPPPLRPALPGRDRVGARARQGPAHAPPERAPRTHVALPAAAAAARASGARAAQLSITRGLSSARRERRRRRRRRRWDPGERSAASWLHLLHGSGDRRGQVKPCGAQGRFSVLHLSFPTSPSPPFLSPSSLLTHTYSCSVFLCLSHTHARSPYSFTFIICAQISPKIMHIKIREHIQIRGS